MYSFSARSYRLLKQKRDYHCNNFKIASVTRITAIVKVKESTTLHPSGQTTRLILLVVVILRVVKVVFQSFRVSNIHVGLHAVQSH